MKLTQRQIALTHSISRERFGHAGFILEADSDIDVRRSFGRVAAAIGSERMQPALGMAEHSALRVARALLIFATDPDDRLVCLPWLLHPDDWPMIGHKRLLWECASTLGVRAEELSNANDPAFPAPSGMRAFAALGPSGRRAIIGEHEGTLPMAHHEAVAQMAAATPSVNYFVVETDTAKEDGVWKVKRAACALSIVAPMPDLP